MLLFWKGGPKIWKKYKQGFCIRMYEMIEIGLVFCVLSVCVTNLSSGSFFKLFFLTGFAIKRF